MIAVDTNVLLRYLLQDDPAQAQRAEKLICGNHRVLITDVVLVDTLWTLQGKKYKASKDDLLTVVAGLLREPSIVFENNAVVWQAMQDYRRTQADFPDALIARKAAEVIAALSEPFEGVYSFDRNAQELAGMRPAAVWP